MDYKYIEQLLERYWECQTSLEEEAILRAFFAQDDIPASLLPYRDLFIAETEMAGEQLSEDFDQRVMSLIEKQDKTASEETGTRVVPFSWMQGLRPLFRAVAVVAIVLTIGMAAQQGFERSGDADMATPAALSENDMQDTISLFTEMPELLEQTEAIARPASQTDTLQVIAP